MFRKVFNAKFLFALFALREDMRFGMTFQTGFGVEFSAALVAGKRAFQFEVLRDVTVVEGGAAEGFGAE